MPALVPVMALVLAMVLALPHRMRRRPFEDGAVDMRDVAAIIEERGI